LDLKKDYRPGMMQIWGPGDYKWSEYWILKKQVLGHMLKYYKHGLRPTWVLEQTKESTMKYYVIAMIFFLTGCGTVAGVGQDIQDLSKTVKRNGRQGLNCSDMKLIAKHY